MSWIRHSLGLARGRISSAPSIKQPALLPPEHPIEEETISDYTPEHYYPVKLHQIFNDAYQVTNKLGYGVNSTVWLARDVRRWVWQGNRYVTLKVFRNGEEFQAAADHEAKVSQRIMAANPDHPGFFHIRKVFDSFEINGLGSAHTCLVCEPMRETLYLFQQRFPDEKINPRALKYIIRFILSGLDYLHTECKIIHTDIKPCNILMSVEDSAIFDAVAKNEEQQPCSRKVTKDRAIYCSIPSLASFGSGQGLPKLADFGNAVPADSGSPLRHPIQPNEYRAPEVMIGAEWSYSADVWNLGVMIWDMLEGKALCNGLAPSTKAYTSSAHLGQLIALLGPAPRDLLSRGERALLNFTPDGQFKYPELVPTGYTLESSVTRIEGEEKSLFLNFARRMLNWRPEGRASCKELLDDPWLHGDV